MGAAQRRNSQDANVCLNRFADAGLVPSRTRPHVKFTLRSRASLVAATVFLQALVLGVGGFVSMTIGRHGVAGRVREQVLEESYQLVDHTFNNLVEITDKPIVFGSPEWSKAQDFIESVKLPAGATLFLLDHTGHILCHPSLKRNANLRRTDYSEQELQLIPSGEQWQLGNLNSGAALGAEVETLGGPASMVTRYDAERGIKIVAMQPVAAIAAAGERLTSGLFWIGAVGSGLILLISAAGSILLVRRYDTVLMRANKHLEEEVERRTRRGLSIRNGLIFGLAKLADYRDTDTGRHLERICQYCEILATSLKGQFEEVTDEWIELLKLASSMHDIGKVGIPDSILLKPGPLSEAERRQMQTHTLIGSDTLVAIRRRVGDDELLNMGIQVALEHHERFDGTGYPYGLMGEEIALSARIVALADMYDALTSQRVYKAPMSHEQACRIILESRGTHFDPRIVDAFLRVAKEFDDARVALTPSYRGWAPGRLAA